MEVLKELSNISNYRPTKGLKYELFKLVELGSYTREDAVNYFDGINKKEQFYTVYKRLKYSLLNGIKIDSADIPNSYLHKVEVWERSFQIRILFITGNLKAAVKLATQNIPIAERHNELEMVMSLAKELKRHYSLNEPNFLKHYRYSQKYEWANKQVQARNKAESVYLNLNLCLKLGSPINYIEKELIELDKIALDAEYYFFFYLYYTVKNLYYRSVKNEQAFLKNNQAAIDYLKNQSKELPYQVKFNFQSELIPYNILKSNFSSAETNIESCLQMPPKGSLNWHKILIYRSYTGFYQNNPKVALLAFKMANSVKSKVDTPAIIESWHIIKGYIAFFAKINRVYNSDNPKYKEDEKDLFRLGKFLNILEKKDNHHQKANLLIIELLHLLVDGNQPKYLDRLERIEPYIKTRFKPHEFKRTRYFLRMLKSVVRGNYHPALTKSHAKKNIDKLTASRANLDVTVLKIEYVPYEILWEEIINFLSKK